MFYFTRETSLRQSVYNRPTAAHIAGTCITHATKQSRPSVRYRTTLKSDMSERQERQILRTIIAFRGYCQHVLFLSKCQLSHSRAASYVGCEVTVRSSWK